MKPPQDLFSMTMDSPVGSLVLKATNRSLIAIHFGHTATPEKPCPLLNRACRELKQYFSGKRKKFTIPFSIQGTPFQKQVWSLTQRVPYGTAQTYGDIAREIGRKKSSRAVGTALGKNRIPLFIPCHRIVSKQNGIGGFSADLAIKKSLLSLEKGKKI